MTKISINDTQSVNETSNLYGNKTTGVINWLIIVASFVPLPNLCAHFFKCKLQYACTQLLMNRM